MEILVVWSDEEIDFHTSGPLSRLFGLLWGIIGQS